MRHGEYAVRFLFLVTFGSYILPNLPRSVQNGKGKCICLQYFYLPFFVSSHA